MDLGKSPSYQEPGPLGDPAKRESDVDKHEDVGDRNGDDVAVGFTLQLILG